MSQPYVDFVHTKEHASFERILAHYNLVVTGQGSQRTVLCPFHDDRRPSCKIELERKIFHCFGCGEKGNVLEFVAKIGKTDLRTAALTIASICGIAPAQPRTTPRTSPAIAEPARRTARRGSATPGPPRKPAEQPSPSPTPAAPPVGNPAGVAEPVNPPLSFELKLDATHPYLGERGLSAETTARFGLGYCARGLMKGRVCVPIHDENGSLVAYAGRWADVGEPPTGEDKYKLPGKFQKNRVLFNLHRVRDAEHLVVVEGCWSVFRLAELGVQAVALMGSSLSDEQERLLAEVGHARFVTVLLDGDPAGRNAAAEIVPRLAGKRFVRRIDLPDGLQPDTIDPEELAELVRITTEGGDEERWP